MKKVAFVLPLIIALTACNGTSSSSSNSNQTPPSSPMLGEWEFTVTTSNPLFPWNNHTYLIEADMGDASPSTDGKRFVTHVWFLQQRPQTPLFAWAFGDPDGCELPDGGLEFFPNQPASGEFNYDLSLSGNFSQGPAQASANGTGTFTASTAEATYLSMQSGPGCASQASDSGTIQGSQIVFSGTWSAVAASSDQTPLHLTFQGSHNSIDGSDLVQITGTIGTLQVSSTMTQYGAFVPGPVFGFSQTPLSFRKVANTTDGYSNGQSGPGIYFQVGEGCNKSTNCSGILIPSN